MARTNIAFAGLTAAGKTTHAKLLAHDLGYRYVSATEILLNILKIEHGADRVWFDKSEEIALARQGDRADEELEQRLLAIAAVETGVVFDTWALAWIGEAPLIRIWIESDLESRTRKCFVSQGASPLLDLAECRELVEEKDRSTQASFMRRHHFDLMVDREKYHAIVHNSHLIPEPTREAADRGINAFAPVISAVARSLIADNGSHEPLVARYPREILLIGRASDGDRAQ